MTFHAVGETLNRKSSTVSRKTLNPYYSVEFSLGGLETVHLFRVRNTNSACKCVMVREDSKMLSVIKIGDILSLKFNFYMEKWRDGILKEFIMT